MQAWSCSQSLGDGRGKETESLVRPIWDIWPLGERVSLCCVKATPIWIICCKLWEVENVWPGLCLFHIMSPYTLKRIVTWLFVFRTHLLKFVHPEGGLLRAEGYNNCGPPESFAMGQSPTQERNPRWSSVQPKSILSPLSWLCTTGAQMLDP